MYVVSLVAINTNWKVKSSTVAFSKRALRTGKAVKMDINVLGTRQENVEGNEAIGLQARSSSASAGNIQGIFPPLY